MSETWREAIELLRTRGTRVVEAADGSAEIIGAVRGRIWMRADRHAEFRAALAAAEP